MDGHEIIENWIVKQPWSNGKVGLSGISYYAINLVTYGLYPLAKLALLFAPYQDRLREAEPETELETINQASALWQRPSDEIESRGPSSLSPMRSAR